MFALVEIFRASSQALKLLPETASQVTLRKLLEEARRRAKIIQNFLEQKGR